MYAGLTATVVAMIVSLVNYGTYAREATRTKNGLRVILEAHYNRTWPACWRSPFSPTSSASPAG